MAAVASSNVSVIIFVARKQGTSLEQFKSYYEDKHIPHVMPMVLKGDHGLIKYTRSYIERDGKASSFPFGGGDKFDYDCVTELVFRSVEDRDAALQEFGQREDEIAADEEKFMDRAATKIIFITDSFSGLPAGL